jgi:hypothetical protein
MWILVFILFFILIGLWDHFFGPKQPPKPKFRPWSPEINELNENLYRNPEANDYQRGSTESIVDQPRPQEPVFRCAPGVIYDEFTHYHGEDGASNYPPDWTARREWIKKRDGFRCQVAGCPNLEGLDVHHIEMIANGGSHALDNLTCLCIVHHWMLPDHQLVRERLPEETHLRRFNMRRAHRRRANGRLTNVRATFERYVKCSVADCESIRDTYDLRCPICESSGIHFAIFDNDLVVGCLGCRAAWKMRRDLLAEEVGTLFGSIFKAWANVGGGFNFDLNNLPDRHFEQTVLCNRCADFARIGIFEPKDGQYGRFHGCTNFRQHECRNTLEKQHH